MRTFVRKRTRPLDPAPDPVPPRVLFVVNDAEFFLHHRGLLADAVRRQGYEVHVASPHEPGVEAVAARGFIHHPLPLDRAGRNPLLELKTALALLALYRRVRPAIVHLITIKAVLYGGVMARVARIPAVVFAVTGLGYTFLAQGIRAAAERTLIWIAYRTATHHPNSRVIVQNPDDREVVMTHAAVPEERIELVRGNGIELDEFPVRAERGGVPIVVLPARMLWDKGIAEFVEAARLLRRRDVQARFVLVGSATSRNPRRIPAAQLEEWVRSEAVEWWGHRSDMPDVLAGAHVVCLPSYREGIPRALIDAAACGRPIVATDVPGCREVVRDGVNGILVPPRRAEPLADALERLLHDPELRREMGARGRALVEREMSSAQTIAQVLRVYGDLTGERRGPPAGGGRAVPGSASAAGVREEPAARASPG